MKLPGDSVSTQKKRKMPGFRIDRFALEQPREIRFYNAADSTSASVVLLTDAAVESDKEPAYRLKINGNVTSPKATLITNLDQISFGLNGKVYWNPADPGLVAMEEFEVRGAFIKAVVTGEIDLKESPIVKKAVVDLAPVALTDILTLLPDSMRRDHRLYEPYFSTDMSIGGRFELTEPMNLTTDTIPTARINLNIPPATLHYGKATFEELALDVTLKTFTNSPDSTLVDVSRCVIAGPATRLEASAILTTLLSDPSFNADIQGEIDLSNLPPVITDRLPGYISGIISADLKANGRASMLRGQRLHRLVADGSLTAGKVYFLSADTSKMVAINEARIDFDSDRLINGLPVLSAKVAVDTANILVGGVDVAVGALSLKGGVEDSGKQPDTTLLMPMGGDLKVSRLNIISITDSAGGRIRNLGGHITMLPRQNHSKKSGEGLGFSPEFLADLHTGHVSAGSLSDRILLNDVAIKAGLHPIPVAGSEKTAKASKAPERHKEYSYIAPDAVFRYVYKKRHHPWHTKRVYTAQAADSNEVLKWNLAKGFSKFLTQWSVKGSVTTTQARLLTPLLPLRNRFSRLEVKFTNDTVNLSDISLRIGRSDIALSGLVTNVRRALTASSGNNLKANLSLLSDTIDINEIAAGAFKGAAYADRVRRGKSHGIDASDDASLQARLDALAKADPGKSAPMLIPVNVDANLKIGARSVVYSDFVLKDMGAELLVYDGGVNLHNLTASSDAGNLSLSALYSAPKPEKMHFGFGLDLDDFNIARFVKLVPALDSIVPLLHDFSGTIGADIAATCRIDSGMNLVLPSLDAAIRITGDNLAFIDPKKYRTLGKWLGFKNKEDNTIKRMNVEMTVADGMMRVYPFAFNIDRYRLGIYGSNDISMNFDYHIAVLKSPLPFRFGITISGNPEHHKVRFGGAKFKEDTAIESVSVVSAARVNLIEQIEEVFRRGVQHSRFAKLQAATPTGYDSVTDPGLSPSDSLLLIQEGLLPAPESMRTNVPLTDDRSSSRKHKDKHHKKEKHDKPESDKPKKRKRFLFF